MVIAHLSDLHLTEGPALDDQATALAGAVDDVLASRPDLVVLTGDYYGRTVPHRPTTAERAVLEAQLVRLAECAPVLVLEGNHDHGESLELTRNLGGCYPVTPLRGAGRDVVYTPAGPVRVGWLAYPTRRWLLAGAERAPSASEAQAQADAAVGGILATWRGAFPADLPLIVLGHFLVSGSRLANGEILSGGEIQVSPHALAAIPVSYGALGHVHAPQEVAPGWHYAGAPWPCSFGEIASEHGWNLVTIDGRAVSVERRAVRSRPWVALEYRWDGTAWERPTPEQEAAATGAVVRVRIRVPDVHAAGCPWSSVLDDLRRRAYRLQEEPIVEATARTRLSTVLARDATLEDRIRAWWSTLPEPPDPEVQAATIEALDDVGSE